MILEQLSTNHLLIMSVCQCHNKFNDLNSKRFSKNDLQTRQQQFNHHFYQQIIDYKVVQN